jgi:hypothetical protein
VGAGLLVTVDSFAAAATAGGGRVEVKLTVSIELDDNRALDVALKLLAAVAAARGGDRAGR